MLLSHTCGSQLTLRDNTQTDTKMFSCPLLAWLHSGKSLSSSVQKQEPAAAEVDASLDSCSLPDRGYAPPDEMAESEDTGVISTPSDTQETSPGGSLSVGRKVVGRGEELVEDTWRPEHR